MSAPVEPGPAAGDVDPSWPVPRRDGTDAASAFAVPFSIGLGLSLVVWTVVAQLVAVLAFVAVGVDVEGNVLAGRVLVVSSQLLTLAVILAGLSASGRLSWRLWGPTRPRWRDLPRGVAVGISGYVLVIAWAVLWTVVVGEPEPSRQMLLDDLDRSVSVVMVTYLAVVLLAPVVEEIVFRGVLFQAARRRLGLGGGVLLSAFVFTAIHAELWQPFQPVSLGGLLLLGTWFAVMFHRTGSLTVPIVAHATFNAINLSLAVFLPQT